MSLDDVLRLTQGSLVELDQREDEPLDVLANGRVVARGEVVVVDERFGLRITEIGTTEDRARTAG
jgi:flagellar motor switch protein FliN/FliY